MTLLLALCAGSLAGSQTPQGEWRAISTENAPVGRVDDTAVWTGREVLVFGGRDADEADLGDGAAYDPASDAWRPLASTGAPSRRAWHTAVWTGREMLVWGGDSADAERGDGAAYDPQLDRWRPLAAAGAPTARGSHVAVWIGDAMLVWAGVDEEHSFPSGGLYDPVADAWRPLTIDVDRRVPRTLPGVWTGAEFLAFGGINGSSTLGHGVAWRRESDAVRLLPATDAPSPRAFHAAVWTGRELVVWGGGMGIYGGRPLGDGARFDPSTDRWAAMRADVAPSPRSRHGYVWTGSELVIAGGSEQNSGDALRSAWAWHPEKGWRRLPDLPEPRAEAHLFATDAGLLLIGGRDAERPRAGGFLLTLEPFVTAEFHATQRRTIVIPGTSKRVRVRLGDISGGKVVVSLLGVEGERVAQVMRVGDAREFDFEGRRLRLELVKFDNRLIGADRALMRVSDARPATEPLRAASPRTEADWIEALLAEVERAPVRFVRNGQAHDAKAAGQHLRRKLSQVRDRITSVEQFIDELASRSSVSGRAYSIRTDDGAEHDAGEWFHARLRELRRAQQTQSNMVTKLELSADYFQFYLQDETAEGDLSDSWSEEAVKRLLALAPGTVGVGTVREDDVPVEIHVLEAEPAADFAAWDHVNQCSIDVPSGRIVVAGCTDYLPDAKRIEVAPGTYRVRVLYGALDSLSADGLDGDDHYRVELWPGAACALTTLKDRSKR